MLPDIDTLTTVHTAISIVAIGAGVPATLALLGSAIAPFWTVLFLATAALTSLTGFAFPFIGITPAFATGIVATLILLLVLMARYVFGLAGRWRAVYSAGMIASVYLLVFVAVAQAFAKIPALHALAPTQAEPPFAIAQVVVLVAFLALGVIATRAFRRAAT